jgi:phage tail-like protein
MADSKDPLVSFHYAIEIQGEVTGFFSECSGLGSEHEVIEQKLVDAKGHEFIKRVPGRLKWENITLKRGITDKADFWKWRQMVEEGKVKDARRNGSIVMMDQELQEVARWDFLNAWPTKVSGPALKSDGNEVGVEELVIAHERLWRTK